MSNHITPRVRENIAHDAGRYGHQMQLPHRAAMTAGQTRIAARRDFVCENLHVVEHETPARRHALAHTVPVVEYLQTLASHRNHDGHFLVVLILHVDSRIVRKGRAGRIVLLACDSKVLAITHELRDDLSRTRRAELRRRAAKNRTLAHALDLRVVEIRAWRKQQLLGQVVMNPQSVGNVRFMGSQRRDDME
jgi:hypothetical protein